MSPDAQPAVLLDVDGTLIDSNYQHAISWHRTLRDLGEVHPMVELHRAIGMGGDQLVKHVVGEAFDAEHGEWASDQEKVRFHEIAGDVAALQGATELIRSLVDRGCEVVLASSGSAEDTHRYMRMLDAEDLKHTTSSDVEETKPEPDLIKAALELVDGDRPALLVGDSTWDVEAAKRAGVPTIGLLTGGFSEPELRDAGAVRVYSRLGDLIEDLDAVLAEARTPDAG